MLAFVVGLPACAFSALTAHMTIFGENQGEIPGSCQMYGREGTIEVYAYQFSISAGSDDICRPTGELNHRPLTIVKDVDRASTALMNALKTNEVLQVTIDFYRVDSTGAEEKYYTINLRDARISGFQQEQFNNRDPDLRVFLPLEKIAFVYADIFESWLPNKSDARLSWNASCKAPLSGDLNFDGIVNFRDFVIMADDWLRASY